MFAPLNILFTLLSSHGDRSVPADELQTAVIAGRAGLSGDAG